jgi:ferritin
MMASEKLIAKMNEQIGNEMGASLQYISIASYCDGQSLPELAGFFYRQADEERDHAMRFVHFILDVEGKVEIPDIPAPKSDFGSVEEAVRLSVDWEKQVTRQIYALVEVAQKDSDYISLRFLDWFVNEQREEVATMTSLLDVVRRAGPDGLLHVEDYVVRHGNPHQGEG